MHINQLKWDAFLVECWFNNPQARMNTVVGMFNIDHPEDNTQLRRCVNPKEVHVWLSDVFGFIAKYLPRLSALLLNTKKGDEKRIKKILKFMRQLDSKLSQESVNYLQKANYASRQATRKADAATASREMVKDQRANSGSSVWKQHK